MLQVTNSFTIEDMRRFAGEAWGELGANVVEQWCRFNVAYFDNALKPVPLIITNTQPIGKRIGFCCYNPGASGRTISTERPRGSCTVVGAINCCADNSTSAAREGASVHSRAWREAQNPSQ